MRPDIDKALTITSFIFTVVFFGFGFGVGFVVGRDTAPTERVIETQCTLEHTIASHVRPCRPDTNRWVIATWEPDLTTTARHHQGKWEFQTPVLGQTHTSRHPQSWSELP